MALEDEFFPTGKAWEESRAEGTPEPTFFTWVLISLMNGALRVASWLDRHAHWLVAIVDAVRWWVWRAVYAAVHRSARAHRFWTGVDFMYCVFAGMARDRLFEPGGYAAIDQYDFREWLGRNGAHEETKWSPYTRAIYDAAFSYDDGRASAERISASVALRTLVRIVFTYKGATYFKMQAGMGDTVFGPLYEVLKGRGVTFKFFHKTSALHLSPDGARGPHRDPAAGGSQVRRSRRVHADVRRGRAALLALGAAVRADQGCRPGEGHRPGVVLFGL
jgi:hypothetical protein